MGCELSYLITIILRKDIVWGLPWSVSLEPTTSCNLQCPQCATGTGSLTRPKGTLNFESFKSIFGKAENHIFYLTLYFQGEPFLNNDIFKMIQYARKKRVFVSTSTNGHFITEEFAQSIIDSGLNKLIISIDGTTQESFTKYRKQGDLNTVNQGLKRLIEVKKSVNSITPHIEIQFIVFKHNEHEIDDIKKLSQLDGVDRVVLKTAQIIHEEECENLLPSNQKYSRYFKKLDGKFEVRKPLRNRCLRLRNTAVITWDGLIVPCCFDKDAAYSSGNILEKTFAEIYQSNNARNFRNRILNDRKSIEMCRNCSE